MASAEWVFILVPSAHTVQAYTQYKNKSWHKTYNAAMRACRRANKAEAAATGEQNAWRVVRSWQKWISLLGYDVARLRTWEGENETGQRDR